MGEAQGQAVDLLRVVRDALVCARRERRRACVELGLEGALGLALLLRLTLKLRLDGAAVRVFGELRVRLGPRELLRDLVNLGLVCELCVVRRRQLLDDVLTPLAVDVREALAALEGGLVEACRACGEQDVSCLLRVRVRVRARVSC